MAEGKPVKVGNREYVVPEATLGVAEELLTRLETLGEGGARLTIRAISEIIHKALSENYPDLTVDQVARGIKLKEAGETMKRVLAAAGLEQSSAGEAQSP